MIATLSAGIGLSIFSTAFTHFGWVYSGLAILQILVALLYGIMCILLPRRPDVFRNGKLVDGQFTGSVLDRFTFSWVAGIIKYASRNKGLEIDDLPVVDNSIRSVNLCARFEEIKGSRKLWKALLIAHFPALLVQQSLAVVQAFFNFAPQLALLGVLRSLEAREIGRESQWQCWAWVLGLGLLMMLSTTIESWLFWLVWSKLAIPIHEQLSAVIFAKSMRRKDVKGITGAKDPESDGLTPTDSAKSQNAAVDEDDETNLQKTRQSIINLIAVDSKRISESAAWNYILPSSLMKIIIACSFLISLLGWRSTLSGLAVIAIVTPINVFMARKYSAAQQRMLECRDEKLAIMTEVLQGIRQVKFSALEGPWQSKITEIRNTELQAQWTSFLYDIGLISIWILGPIMLSAVSLAVYALTDGELTASVAFTSISIFGSLELSLAVLPELISDFVEAWISMGRIDKHLSSPERTTNTVPADTVSFEDAAVAWPTDDETMVEDRFVLRNLNLQFPANGLSVIGGKTGSGKSLLLAAILGECDVLSGAVKAPHPPAIEDRFDEYATRSKWIIDSAIAYVAQIPWIENASIKDNILFDLPYDPERYRKVLSACTLEKDLEMLPDGELTDIGANGINLSGGQRWRVSFARALYSRAGILIMDDIFSAVDAHTGRHLFEHALTGELGQGRTRILVTHHIALCLPRTDYSVFLEDGSAKYAGTVEELRRTDGLRSILIQQIDTREPDRPIAVNDVTADDGATLQRILSNRSRASSIIDGGDELAKRAAPRKFVEDEGREKGSIRLAIYKSYLRSGGGAPYWTLVITAFVSYMAILVGRVSVHSHDFLVRYFIG